MNEVQASHTATAPGPAAAPRFAIGSVARAEVLDGLASRSRNTYSAGTDPEFFFRLSGRSRFVRVRTEGATIGDLLVGPGCIRVLLPNADVDWSDVEGAERRCLWLRLNHDWDASARMQHLSLPRRFGALGHKSDPLLSSVAFWLADELQRGSCSSLYVESLAVVMHERIMRAARCTRSATSARSSGLAPWQLKRVTDYIATHLEDNVSLTELAALVDLSPHHLCRAFKASVGVPPHRFQIRLRIERAQVLLSQTLASVIDVAAAVGYDDPNQLARVFRKEVGASPTAYRQQRLSRGPPDKPSDARG